jgi:hypothetical protein
LSEARAARPAILPFSLAALAGFSVCLAITFATGRKEAWDSSLYFVAGIPAMCALVLPIAWAWPASAWRWAIGMALGQSIALLMGGGSFSLWPLTLIAMTVLSLPQAALAIVAGRWKQRLDRSAAG